jgi:hypothetical protein
VRLQLALPAPAQERWRLRLMLIGQVAQVDGATVHSWPAGRACRSTSDVQQLLLSVQPGARSVQLLVTPLAFHPAR